MNAAPHPQPAGRTFHPAVIGVIDALDTPAAQWRVTLHDAVTELCGLLDAVDTIDISSHNDNAYAFDIVHLANHKIEDSEDLRRTGSADDYYAGCIGQVHSLLRGAMSLPELSHSLRLLVTAAHDKVAEVSSILDTADVTAPPTHAAAPARIEKLMAGKARFCNMADAIMASRGRCYFEPEFRMAGTFMNTEAARAALAQVQRDPDETEGFLFALVGYIANAEKGDVSPYKISAIRELPATCFEAGQYGGGEPAQAPAVAQGEPIQPAPEFTDPFEQRTDALLQELDMYLEGLEHVGLGEKAHADLHKLATPHYWNARNHLNDHDTPDRMVAEICALREGMDMLAAWIAPSPGLPLLRECMALIDDYLTGTSDSGDAGAIEPAEALSLRLTHDRMHTIWLAGAYIEKLLTHLRGQGQPPKPEDWSALDEAASVVMSGAADPMESDAQLEERLDAAIDSASALLQDQLPKHLAQGGALRAKDAGKVIVAAVD